MILKETGDLQANERGRESFSSCLTQTGKNAVSKVTNSHYITANLDSQLTIPWNSFNLCKVPFLVAQRTNTSCLQPTLDAIQVKDVTAISKGN
mmetsp:Transcript_2048/g.4642  ORF Transcript_2048/g.4642 Transcript_2048/m.4642 type:complete len:93 (-) Transcript_2048:348-626(-)